VPCDAAKLIALHVSIRKVARLQQLKSLIWVYMRFIQQERRHAQRVLDELRHFAH
jgi:hypothetical protein